MNETTVVPAPPAVRSRRILIADDNADVAESLRLLLERDGHRVQMAGDGEAALAASHEFRPEVALIDIGMPKLNGYDVARRLRDSDWGRNIYLIALTGWGQQGDRERARDAGFDDHVLKPASPELLRKTLATLP